MDEMLILINLNYDDGEQGHVIYRVPKDRYEDAIAAVNAARTLYDTAPDGETIEECVEELFRANGIACECMTYETVNLRF